MVKNVPPHGVVVYPIQLPPGMVEVAVSTPFNVTSYDHINADPVGVTVGSGATVRFASARLGTTRQNRLARASCLICITLLGTITQLRNLSYETTRTNTRGLPSIDRHTRTDSR